MGGAYPMRVFIDTNVLLDFLNRREPFYGDAEKIINSCCTGKNIGIISTFTVLNSLYVARKMYQQEALHEKLLWMLHSLPYHRSIKQF